MTRFVEDQLQNASSRQCSSTFRFVCESVLCKIRHNRVELPNVLVQLSPMCFSLFRLVKWELKGTIFDSMEAVKPKVAVSQQDNWGRLSIQL